MLVERLDAVKQVGSMLGTEDAGKTDADLPHECTAWACRMTPAELVVQGMQLHPSTC